MELSRREVPLYGQAKVFMLLSSVREVEEVFVVLEGSSLLHVLPTKLHSMLFFIAPGHNRVETVCVRAYTLVGGAEVRYVGVSFLTYVEDDAQELAERLVTHGRSGFSGVELGDLIHRYALTNTHTHTHMDHRVTLALANLQMPRHLFTHEHHESLLHLCVRLGFVRVLEFLLCQPGALMLISSPNQQGATPLQLAQSTNQQHLIRLLTHPPNPLATPLGGVSQVWLGPSHLLRFSHTFGVMSLSVSVSGGVSSYQHLQSAVLLLRDCMRDSALLNKVKAMGVSRRSDHSALLSCSDEALLKQPLHSDVPYSEWLSSSSDDENEEEELLLSSNSDGSEAHTNRAVTSPAGNEAEHGGDQQESCTELLSFSGSQSATHTCISTDTPEETTTVIESKKTAYENWTAEEEEDDEEECSPVHTHHRQHTTENTLDTAQHSIDSCIPLHRFRGDSVSYKIPLKANSASMLLCTSSQSSPALFTHSLNSQQHRRRSNSEGCGQEVTMRKSWSLIGDTPLNPSPNQRLTQSTAAPPLNYAADSWSSLVEPDLLTTLDRDAVKRQEVIYELMQTEFHHVETLTVMAEVLRRGLLEEVQLEQDVITQIFPSLDELVALHRSFLDAMETRQRECIVPGNRSNYVIQQIGDILLQQFSGATGDQMMELYGDFCSKHSEALKVYKQLQQSNRKLQLFIRQQSSNSVIKRREIPEFLLLITQRITKYPVLLERLLQHTQQGTEEQRAIVLALEGLRGVLWGVEGRVAQVQRAQQLDEVVKRLDNKSFTRLKSGAVFSKQELQNTERTLTHSSNLTCRTTSGRMREVLALLLTDILVFLQEKEQKLIFAALEQKSSVVPLQGLILREIANQERGLFLISSESAAGPEMYEIHTSSREERDTWITMLHSAAHSGTPDQQLRNEQENMVKKINLLQESVFSLDMQVCAVLEEKLCVCAGGLTAASCHLLVQPHPQNTLDGYTLLTRAQREVLDLVVIFMSVFSSTPSSFFQLAEELKMMEPVLLTPALSTLSLHLQVVERVQSLTQTLYSLQAAVILQDSVFEVQKLLMQEDLNLPPPHHHHPHPSHTDSGNLKCGGEGQEVRVEVSRSEAEWQTELDQRETELTEWMERIKKEREELQQELEKLERSKEELREEEKRVDRERTNIQRLHKQVTKDKQHHTANRNRSLSTITPPHT